MKDFENLTEVKTDSQEIFDGVVVHLYKDTVSLPNGHPAVREVIRHVGAVGVIPLTDDGKVIIERQFRYPLNQVITETQQRIPVATLSPTYVNTIASSIKRTATIIILFYLAGLILGYAIKNRKAIINALKED